VRERDAERGEADHAERGEQDERDRLLGPLHAVDQVADHDDREDLEEGVQRGRPDQPREVGAGRYRGAPDALENALVAEQREVEGERGERGGEHAHAGDAGDQHLQLLVVRRERRRDQEQQEQGQQEVEERRARVAPEELSLEAELLPGEGDGAHSRPAPLVSSR
jgi:hypothetical protein